MFELNDAKVEALDRVNLTEVSENEQAVLEPVADEGVQVSDNGLELTAQEQEVYDAITQDSIRMEDSLNGGLEPLASGGNTIPGGTETAYCVFAGANSRCGCKCCR